MFKPHSRPIIWIAAALVAAPLPAARAETQAPASDQSALEQAPPPPIDDRPIDRESTYILRPGDELTINVWGEKDLDRQVRISEDGSFPFPPIGNVQASGRSTREIELDIQKGLLEHSEDNAGKTSFPSMSSASEGGEASSLSKIAEQTYLLQGGDELSFTVWGHDDLNETVRVRDNGTFSFPLIGDVQGGDRNLKDVEQEVQDRLGKDYIVNPQVTATLSEPKFSVLGDVQNPGVYPCSGPVDLLTVISQAGSKAEFSALRVEVLRSHQGKKYTAQAQVDQILKGAEPNIAILPRDTVYVQEMLKLEEHKIQVVVQLSGAKFSILGDVERPGSYEIAGPIDLLTAVSMAGGATKFASAKVEIIREEPEGKRRIQANLDRIIRGKDRNIAIFPHDNIYVRRRLL